MPKLLALVAILFVFFSCKKEKTTWGTSWTAPLVHGTLTLDDLIDTSYQETNGDGYLSFVINEPVYSFSVDTLIDLPDTTIIAKSAIGVPSLTVNPGFSFGDNYDQEYDLGQIELKEVLIQSGLADVNIASPWGGKSTVDFSFTGLTYLGVPLTRSYNLEAGSTESPATITDQLDLSAHLMNLTGSDGNKINTIEAALTMGSNETVDSYIITSGDSVIYEISFKDLVPSYARGYFGSYTFTDTTGIKLPFMNKILSGSIELDSIDLNMSIRNGFNLIAQAKITKVTGINTKTGSAVDMTFPLLNQSVNINPASGGYYDFTPTFYPFEINNSNSNLLAFLENLSDSIVLGYELKINPFGNTSGGHDEFFPGSTFDLFIDGEFPLSFGANAITIADTLAIDYTASTSVTLTDGVIRMSYTNGFPLTAWAYLDIIDAEGNKIGEITSDDILNSGTYDAITYATTPMTGLIEFNLDLETIEALENGANLILYVQFSTPSGDNIKITEDAFFDFNINSNLNINFAL